MTRLGSSIFWKPFQSSFLREMLAAGAGISVGRYSLEELSGISKEMRYDVYRDNLEQYFEGLKLHRQFGDFQGLAKLPLPRPLQLHIEPSILHGHFRAWLRRRGIEAA